ncbi:MAG: hypothetical protein LH471_05305, partial [Salinibacterium sp.]|nr:hypothetical protein [Salinibacterium sp.]
MASAPLSQPAALGRPAVTERRAARRKPRSPARSRIARPSAPAAIARRPAPAAASVAKSRKHPISVLVTMATVGGMFA